MAKSSSEPDLESKFHQYMRRRELHPAPKRVRRAISKANHVQETHLIDPQEHDESPLFKRYELLLPIITSTPNIGILDSSPFHKR
ncbi:hypothetical protein VN97_g6217 [Penicillium thymicola]|uniref:Uncharacterized protein n=1 Tax=Penicillium thymicola TaxID=293382 RepID=A0AAI9X8H5_PENTH|nr:hypothetical protein VN97_g6217 [Penicillium thymicola]